MELIEHLMSFDKNKRSSELTMLLLAGYQVLYGKGDTGLDKSTSMLLDERDHLISLLASRLGQQPQPQINPPTYPPHTESTRRRGQEGTGNLGQEQVPSPSPAPKREVRETESRASNASKNSEGDNSNNVSKSAPKKIYNQHDLTDEDPSIHEVPEPDLEEDVVDPLSLFD